MSSAGSLGSQVRVWFRPHNESVARMPADDNLVAFVDRRVNPALRLQKSFRGCESSFGPASGVPQPGGIDRISQSNAVQSPVDAKLTLHGRS